MAKNKKPKSKKHRGGDGCEVIDCERLPKNNSLNNSGQNYLNFKTTCNYEKGNKENIINKNINQKSIDNGVSFLPKDSNIDEYLTIINNPKYCINHDEGQQINPTNNNSTTNNNPTTNNNTEKKTICDIKSTSPLFIVTDSMFEDNKKLNNNNTIYQIYQTIIDKVNETKKCERPNTILKVTNGTQKKTDNYNDLYHNLFTKEYLNNTTTSNPYYIRKKNRQYINMEPPKKKGGTRRRKNKRKTRKTNKKRIYNK